MDGNCAVDEVRANPSVNGHCIRPAHISFLLAKVKRAVEEATGHTARSQRLVMEAHPRLCATDRLSSFSTARLETVTVTVHPHSTLMQVFIIEPSRGDTHCVDVTPTQSVRELKEAIAYLTGSDPSLAVVELDGKALHDDRRLQDAKVRKGSTVLLRGCGGNSIGMDGEEESGLVDPADWRSAYGEREDEDEGKAAKADHDALYERDSHSLLVDMDGPRVESPGLYTGDAREAREDGFCDWGGQATDEE